MGLNMKLFSGSQSLATQNQLCLYFFQWRLKRSIIFFSKTWKCILQNWPTKINAWFYKYVILSDKQNISQQASSKYTSWRLQSCLFLQLMYILCLLLNYQTINGFVFTYKIPIILSKQNNFINREKKMISEKIPKRFILAFFAFFGTFNVYSLRKLSNTYYPLRLFGV